MPTAIEFLAEMHAQAEWLDRPMVTLCYAQSMDGSIAARRGEPTRLSGPEAMSLTHALRAWHDGILVGIGTVTSDDPRLTVRLVEGENPQPVVLDSRLSMPVGAALMKHPKPPWLVCGTEAAGNSAQLSELGARVEAIGLDDGGRVALPGALRRLRELGIRRLMVEGGARVITSFLRAGLADGLVATIAPILLGGLSGIDGKLGVPFPRLDAADGARVGKDWVIWGRLRYDEP